jgi:Tfp pilus assembly protein PilN
VEIFNPLLRITDRCQPLDPELVSEGGTRLAVVIGLALDHGQGLNLLPDQAQRRQRAALANWFSRPAVKQAAMAAVGVLLALQVIGGVLQWRLGRQQAVWRELESGYHHSMAMIAERSGLERTMGQVQQLLDQEPIWDGLMKELGTLVPAGVLLEHASVAVDEATHHRVLRLKGTAQSVGDHAQGSVGRLVESMQESLFFTNVEVADSELVGGDAPTIHFEIEARLR